MLLGAGPTGLLKWESAEVSKAHFENSYKFSGFFNLYNEHDLQK